jgi:hypothetical protein
MRMMWRIGEKISLLQFHSSLLASMSIWYIEGTKRFLLRRCLVLNEDKEKGGKPPKGCGNVHVTWGGVVTFCA